MKGIMLFKKNKITVKKIPCKECYKKVDGEHIVVPIRDLSFLAINLNLAFQMLETRGHEFSEQEKDTEKKLWEIYAPIIHYWSAGQFYDMSEEEHKKFKFKHKSYM